jgi:hypothetical protein
MQEEIDRLRLADVLLGGEDKGVDAEQLGVAGGADMALELGDDARTPGSDYLQGAEAIIKKLFVDLNHAPSRKLHPIRTLAYGTPFAEPRGGSSRKVVR